jgi:hypothetical protein
MEVQRSVHLDLPGDLLSIIASLRDEDPLLFGNSILVHLQISNDDNDPDRFDMQARPVSPDFCYQLDGIITVNDQEPTISGRLADIMAARELAGQKEMEILFVRTRPLFGTPAEPAKKPRRLSSN